MMAAYMSNIDAQTAALIYLLCEVLPLGATLVLFISGEYWE